ncbi:MAG: helix-hairpin-helix domain-containing protein, partial [Gemmatimonadota bacterium]
PQVLGPVRERRSGSERAFAMPDRCPACDSKVERPQDEIMTYCPNVSCPGRVKESIVHFASRGAMDIRGLGYERVQKLLDAKLIADVADLYRRPADQLVELDGYAWHDPLLCDVCGKAECVHDAFAAKSAEQLVEAIAASKKQPLSRLLFALGIRHVGDGAADLLSRRFGTMDALMKASAEAIGEVRGIGPTIAEAVAAFFAEPRNRELIDRLREAGLKMSEPQRTAAPGPFEGHSFVLTGTFSTLSRTEATKRIEAAGGAVTGSVSKQTTAIVAGEEPGSKIDKARTLGIQVWDEAMLLDKLGKPT